MTSSNVGRENKRKFRRHIFQEPVEYHIIHSDQMGGCLAKDVSVGGIQVLFHQFLPINTEVSFDFSIDSESGILNRTASVVWVADVPHCERYRVGLKFDKPLNAF